MSQSSRFFRFLSFGQMQIAVILLLAGMDVVGAAYAEAGPARELIIPVRVAAFAAPEVLTTGKTQNRALLVCSMGPSDIHRAIVLLGVLPAAVGDKLSGSIDDSTSLVQIYLADRPTGGRKVPLEEVVEFGKAGSSAGGSSGWQFVGLRSDDSSRQAKGRAKDADKVEEVIISADPAGGGLIVGAEFAGPSGCRLVKRIEWIRSPGQQLFLIIGPENGPIEVILLDRFGRTWLGRTRMAQTALADQLRRRLARDPKLKVMIIYDRFALQVDRQGLEKLCRNVGLGADRIVSRLADRRMRLAELMIPKNQPELQRQIISTKLPGQSVGWRHNQGFIEQIRRNLLSYRDQFNTLREQINVWHQEFKHVTTRKAAKTD